nr:tetratricopeptide repeat protein [Erythrobacter sp. 3-20A1M]
MQSGDLAGARLAIEGVVRSYPKSAAAWHLCGVIRRRAGDHAAAVEAFAAATKAGLLTAEIANSMACSLQELGRLTEAESAFAEAISRDPAYLPARVNLARLKAEAGRFTEAIALLEETIRAHPRSILALNALGRTLREAGEPKYAAETFARTLQIDPDNAEAVVYRGQALRESGRPSDAQVHFSAALGKFGDAPELLESHAGALIDMGETDAAKLVLDRLISKFPSYMPGHQTRARYIREFGLQEDAYSSYRDLARRHPNEQVVWSEWLRLALSYRDYAEVLEVAERATAETGRSATYDYAAAVAHGELLHADNAIQLFSSLEGILGDVPAYLTAFARQMLRTGEPQLAEQLATKATYLSPHDQFAWAYLSLAWRLQDDPREFWLHDYEEQVRYLPVQHLHESKQLERLSEHLQRLHAARHHPPDQSLRGGTQTFGALFVNRSSEIVELERAIRTVLHDYIATLPDDDQHPYYCRKAKNIRFIGSWSVRLAEGGFHVAHIHHQGWVSSALHIEVPAVQPDEPKQSGALFLGSAPDELGLSLEPRRVILPRPGYLALFPSSLWHGTHAYRSDEERLTVAFDAVPS